eukprot:7943230-Karenia_brevis.AAC.1
MSPVEGTKASTTARADASPGALPSSTTAEGRTAARGTIVRYSTEVAILGGGNGCRMVSGTMEGVGRAGGGCVGGGCVTRSATAETESSGDTLTTDSPS